MSDESAAIKTSLNTHMSNKYSHLLMIQVSFKSFLTTEAWYLFFITAKHIVEFVAFLKFALAFLLRFQA